MDTKMDTILPLVLSRLRWWRFETELVWRASPGKLEPGDALTTLYGLFKTVPAVESVFVTYRGKERSLRFQRLPSGQSLTLIVTVCARTVEQAKAWTAGFERTLLRAPTGFQLCQLGALEYRSYDQIRRPDLDQTVEVLLRFETPLPFPRQKGEPNTFLSASTLLRLMRGRLHAAFGVDIDLGTAAGSVEVLSGFWHYDEIRRVSRSSNPEASSGSKPIPNKKPPHLHYLNGCRGPLYLRGDLSPLLPWLLILEEIQLDRMLASPSPLGHFCLVHPCPPAIGPSLLDRLAIADIATITLRQNDVEPLIDPQTGEPMESSSIGQTIAREFEDLRYVPAPYKIMPIRKDSEGVRIIERLSTKDLIAQHYLNTLLAPVIDSQISESSVGYRKGRSRHDAIARVREHIRDGCRYVVDADVADFFPSIEHATLIERVRRLLPNADSRVLDLLRRVIAAPQEQDGRVIERTRGLAQGSPLSPALANLYLDDFDQALIGHLHLVRYADDFVILTRTRDEAEAALGEAESRLAALGLQLSKAKTEIHRIADGFIFVGEYFDDGPATGELTPVLPQKKPVFISEPYCLVGVNGDALDIHHDHQLLTTYPLRRVSEILITSRAVLSTALLEKCARFGIPISIALGSGNQIGTFAPDSRAFFAIAAQQAQWFNGLSDTARASIAGELVAAKIDNYLTYIESNQRAGDSVLMGELRTRRAAALASDSPARARGHEGLAARACFAWLQSRIIDTQRPFFESKRRERTNPDRFNSLLNFGYYLLFMRLNALVRAHGLNPYLGFLHDGDDDFESLVADLQEPFRVQVDRLVMNMINLRVIGADDFNDSPRGQRLVRRAAQRFVSEFERLFAERSGHVVLRDALVAQVRAIRAWQTERGPFWIFRWARAKRSRSDSETPASALDLTEESVTVQSDGDRAPS
ncbi:MAG: CRISPR-associated endonuclease Cas1 [Gammaproteobacteria bacterium]